MKLFSIQILLKSEGDVKLIYACNDLSSFGYFKQTTAKEFFIFTGKLIGKKIQPYQRALVKEKEYHCHVYVRGPNDLAAVLLADQEYPQRVAQNILSKAIEEFASQFESSKWATLSPDTTKCKSLEDMLAKYQDPKQADAMTRLQTQLDETKIILLNTVEAVLERGEKLDDLVERSNDLSTQSKTFYTTAKKTNSCCTLL